MQRSVQGSADELLAAELSRGNAADLLPDDDLKRNELTPILIIAFSLIGLCAIAYVAWSRGMFSLPEHVADSAINFEEIGFATRPAYPKNEELTALLEDSGKANRPLKVHARMLYDCQAAYARIQDSLNPLPDPDTLQHDLDLTAAVSKQLLADYEEFETTTVPKGRSLSADTVSMLRTQYASRAGELMAILQVGYVGLENPEHPAFLLTDTLPQLFGRFGFIDATAYTDQWQHIREFRRQLELDVQYATMIDDLQAWYSTLAGLHEEVDKVIRNLGEVSSNRGRLNPAAVKLIVLLDDYATKIEGLNTDFEEHVEELEKTESDTVNELIANFRALALEDHMYCFGEIYRRYAEDRFAELEQYDRLARHYEYAEQWWPRKKPDYQGIFTTYENRWKQNWMQ